MKLGRSYPFLDVVSSTFYLGLIGYIVVFVQADSNLDVRTKMVEAGVAIIDRQGNENVGLLLPILENYLDKKVSCFNPT